MLLRDGRSSTARLSSGVRAPSSLRPRRLNTSYTRERDPEMPHTPTSHHQEPTKADAYLPVFFPQQAWSAFTDHVRRMSRADLDIGQRKEMFLHLCSDTHSRIVRGIRRREKKRRSQSEKPAKDEACDGLFSATLAGPEDSSDDDFYSDSDADTANDDENDRQEIEDRLMVEEQLEAERRKAMARQHWGIIKRFIQDRIKQRARRRRRGYNTERTLNQLRAQARIGIKPEEVRRELFVRYGIIPRAGRSHAEDVMKPVYPTKARDIVAQFDKIQISSLKNQRGRSLYGRKHHQPTWRPNTAFL